jgi:hypothetical protein
MNVNKFDLTDIKVVLKYSSTLNKKDICKLLNISSSSFDRLVNSGNFPSYDFKICRREEHHSAKNQWSKKTLLKWIQENEHQ